MIDSNLEARSSRGSLLSLLTRAALLGKREKTIIKKDTLMVIACMSENLSEKWELLVHLMQPMRAYLQQVQKVHWLHCCHQLQGFPKHRDRYMMTCYNNRQWMTSLIAN